MQFSKQSLFSCGLASAVIALAAGSAIAQEPVAASVPAASTPNMTFSFSAPFISSSGLLGDHHIIDVMVVGMGLEDLDVTIPSQMARFNRVRVLDGTGREIPASIEASRSLVSVKFDQPVEPGQTVRLDISGVNTNQEEGQILLYGVTARRVGLRGSIPIGTARIHGPSHN